MNKIYTHQQNCVCLLTHCVSGSNCVDALCFYSCGNCGFVKSFYLYSVSKNDDELRPT